jgi:ribosome maturation factor RimP
VLTGIRAFLFCLEAFLMLHLQRKKDTIEGDGHRSLLSFPEMTKEQIIEQVRQWVEELLKGTPDAFLVEVRIKPTNNLKVFVDADSGFSIDHCVKLNRALYKKIEEGGLFPAGDFSLEVSSPGLDEPLKLQRQYLKNVGRKVEVLPLEGTAIQGVLKAAHEKGILLEVTEGKGKKAVVKEVEMEYSVIKQTKIIVVF